MKEDKSNNQFQYENRSSPLLKIFLLGRFRAEIDGVAVAEKRWTRRSAQSLVKLLALKPHHTLHREQIIDLMWAEESQETALNNLNKAIYAARRAFEPNLTKGSASRFIVTSKNQIILDSPGTLVVDLDEFERLANYALRNNDLGAGNKAVESYRGELLVEDIYEDWVYTRRESMQILFRKTATKTAELFAARGEHQSSIEILKKLIAADSSDERIHRLLMRFYAETGSKYQALKQFEHCRAALLEIGIEPEAKTAALEQSIKRGGILPVKNGFKPASAKSSARIVSAPRISPLTFQNGFIRSAHFPPDAETIVFSADFDGGEAELYSTHLTTGETRRLGIKDTEVLSVSPAGEMAIALNPRFLGGFSSTGTLAKLSAGKTPLELLEDVQGADWHPSKNADFSSTDARNLAVVRDENGKSRLEYPIGKAIFETGGWISHPRFSAGGKKIAFIEHPLRMDDAGFVVVLDLADESRKKRILTDLKVTIMGLAWSNEEIWFTAAREGITRKICAVNLKGEERRVYSGMGCLTLRDVADGGKTLVTVDKKRYHIAARRTTSERLERDLSWHDWTLPRDLTDDGETLLFEEAGTSGGNHYSAYVRKIDGSATRKIGDGSAIALAPDGKHALLRINSCFDRLVLMPIGAGETKTLENLPSNPLVYQPFACFFPDGKRILFSANEIDRGRRIYTQNLDGGVPVCFTPDEGVEMFSTHSISPDGRYVVLNNSENKLSLYQTTGGTSVPLRNLEKGFSLVRWCGDGENLFIRRRGEMPAVVYKYNLASGKKEKWLELRPKNASGVIEVLRILLTPDGETYAYSFVSESSDLYLMENLS